MRVGAQLHAPAALPPEKTQDADCTGGLVGPTVGLDECRKSRPPPGLDTRTVQPVGRSILIYGRIILKCIQRNRVRKRGMDLSCL